MHTHMKKEQYTIPAIEIIEMDHEGVMASSPGAGINNFGDGGNPQFMRNPGFDFAEFENVVNDLFTTIND